MIFWLFISLFLVLFIFLMQSGLNFLRGGKGHFCKIERGQLTTNFYQITNSFLLLPRLNLGRILLLFQKKRYSYILFGEI